VNAPPKHISKKVPVKEGWQGFVLSESITKEVKGKQVLLLRVGWRLSLSNIHSLQKHKVKHMYVWVKKPPKHQDNDDETKE